ncbi:tagatose-6-phosphate kinase [Staphylococcus americanisciuri]|uniref:Tagatose-6-phosphate kinase n=1 Tax=Staphylococcus americanisciuri TaxID=2973940 RepID=A0ABT2F2U6_9STAP|nr:tagatose-6-phosphate kinase [Staphylococcus americanisciuri]MCS4486741.1 tagatose-6-phosphate kinase [Staphylococcus americanisciuri]
MILTVTMNPSVDIAYTMTGLTIDNVNRVQDVRKTAGGKGLNVTRVLKQLNADVVATGLLGGVLGDAIKNELTSDGIQHDFWSISGATRNCIALLHDGAQTEILESGPVIQESEAEAFIKHLKKLADQADILSFSGSLPKGLPTDFYHQMISACPNKPVVLDCAGDSLVQVLNKKNKPQLIKPNIEELSVLLGRTVTTQIADLKAALSQPLFADIEWIVVSLGANGAFAKHFDTFYRVTIPTIDVVNPVGSGDATVAGMTAALVEGLSDEALLKQGNVLGMLNAQEATTGYVQLEHYQTLYEQIKVESV